MTVTVRHGTSVADCGRMAEYERNDIVECGKGRLEIVERYINPDLLAMQYKVRWIPTGRTGIVEEREIDGGEVVKKVKKP